MALAEYLASGDGAPEERTEGGFVRPVRAVLRDIKGKVQEVVRTREDEYAIPYHVLFGEEKSGRNWPVPQHQNFTVYK
jgi:hypothetical protein